LPLFTWLRRKLEFGALSHALFIILKHVLVFVYTVLLAVFIKTAPILFIAKQRYQACRAIVMAIQTPDTGHHQDGQKYSGVYLPIQQLKSFEYQI
jgi:hypothetical protein